MHTNYFNTFSVDNILSRVLHPISVTEEETSTVGSSVCSMLQPFLLHPGYGLSYHCTFVANKQEKIGTTEAADGVQQGGESSQTNGESDFTYFHDSCNSSG